MCGIVAIATRDSSRPLPDLSALADRLRAVADALSSKAAALDCATLDVRAAELIAIDRALRGAPGVVALVNDPIGAATLAYCADALDSALAACERGAERAIDAGRVDDVEALNAALVRTRDAAWAITHDRLRAARAVEDLAGGRRGRAAIQAYYSIQLALSALDRLEGRGRDSAGLHLFVHDHGLDLAAPTVQRLIAERSRDPLYGTLSVRVARGALSFVYKRAAEVGELGDNTAALRAQIRGDDLLRLALGAESVRVLVLGHTRWASVGIISEPNCHPLNHEELAGGDAPYVVGALNGDVDNYADLAAHEELQVSHEITTDAKVIPALVSRRIAAGSEPIEAFRTTVARFEGSVAIAAVVADDPDLVLLAQRGSGQALYVGLTDDTTIVASEPYGVVEIADRYFRLDGEAMREAGNPATQGEVVALDARLAGSVVGVRRFGYEGTELPVADDELRTPEITTRDIDRGPYPHYLLKEIVEAPASFRKTLRGRLVESDGHLDVHLGPETIPVALRDRLRRREIRRVVVIGQGTAAVAGQSFATVFRRLVAPHRVPVEAVVATELSGFGLDGDMRDTLVVAISQSGTTTDTNRTVDIVRSRGASVIAIVNRRASDLVDKSDGVLYTSDGRDVEMSVASTKAFYAQIAAGFLLAFAIAARVTDDASGEAGVDPIARDEVLRALRGLPEQMAVVVERRDAIAAAAQRHAPSRRYWAVVGNGANRTAAQEVRIKLSELCYKSIACDLTEDKKHIDLSSEPLILVCAAGLSGSNADDVGKEVAIYRAHKAAPIVISDDGEHRLGAALETISVPAAHPHVAFVLSAMAGHLFGYEAALAIDASARPLREARGAIEACVASYGGSDDALVAQMTRSLHAPAKQFIEVLRAGGYDGSLEAGTAVRLAALFRYATGNVPLDLYALELGKVGTPSTLVEDLTAALTVAIEELTRPIDAIKHQAKTVTVGISRSDETLLGVRLVQALLDAGCARDHVSYRALRTLVELDAAVDVVAGFTRYRIDGDVAEDALISVVDRGGVAAALPSRTEADPHLRGTKHRAALEREVTVFRGRADNRTGIMVPEVKDNAAVGLTLLHCRFHDRLPADAARRVLQGYRDRYGAIKDQVTELEPTFREQVLAAVPLVDLLTEPVVKLAEHWRATAG
jgi:glucosamine--fructose-6-phosphate aminotransferase (isomerizing)